MRLVCGPHRGLEPRWICAKVRRLELNSGVFSMASVTVRIPPPLRTFTEGKDEVTVQGGTVGEIIDALEASAPGIKERIADEKGVRRSVNIFLGEEDIRFLDALGTELKDGDVVSIIPAIAGGI
jgi:sulfur-carrier protein